MKGLPYFVPILLDNTPLREELRTIQGIPLSPFSLVHEVLTGLQELEPFFPDDDNDGDDGDNWFNSLLGPLLGLGGAAIGGMALYNMLSDDDNKDEE